MHLELVSLLRCPVPHADGWLVASVNRKAGRMIVDGMLGCPICNAEFLIRHGVTHLIAPSERDAVSATSSENAGEKTSSVGIAPPSVSNGDEGMRLAALLGVSDATQVVALVGHPVGDALALQALVPVPVLVFNDALVHIDDASAQTAPTDMAHDSMPPLGVIQMAHNVPVARMQLSAVAVHDHAALLTESASHAVRAAGRLLAPVSSPIPEGFTEVVRDARHWLAERLATASAPVPLSRRR